MFEALAVLLIECAGESGREVPFGVDVLAPSDQVGPKGDLRAGNVSPKHVEAFVPII